MWDRQREYWRIVKDEGAHLLRIDDVGGREPKRGESEDMRKGGQQTLFTMLFDETDWQYVKRENI